MIEITSRPWLMIAVAGTDLYDYQDIVYNQEYGDESRIEQMCHDYMVHYENRLKTGANSWYCIRRLNMNTGVSEVVHERSIPLKKHIEVNVPAKKAIKVRKSTVGGAEHFWNTLNTNTAFVDYSTYEDTSIPIATTSST